MKAPTADYSPLSQALNAKTSAIQASYSTKDTANWKSRYKIQTDSFKLQNDALAEQQKANTVGAITSLITSGFDVVADVGKVAQAFEDEAQDNITQKVTLNTQKATDEINAILQNNPQFSETRQENGTTYVGLSDEGQKAINEIVETYFPEGTKYGWGMDDKVQMIKEQVLASANTYAGEIATQRTQDEANAAYSNNMQNALFSDLQSGATITAKIPDVSAEGGYREVKVGAGQEALISSREPYMGKTWADNQRQIAAAELTNKRSDYLISDASTNFSNGTYVTDSSRRANFDSLVKAQAEEYTDETQKQAFLTSVKSAETQAVTTYFDNQVKTILDQDLDSYTSLSSLYDSLTDTDGQYYSIFFDKNGKPNANIEPSTYTAIKSSVSTQLSNIETLNGTTNTQAVQNAFGDLNNQFSMGQINSTTYGAKAQSIMVGIYGDNWMSNSEAVNVYKNQIMSQLPDDLTSDPQVANGISIAYNTALGTNNKAYKDLDADQQAKADVISKDYIDNVTKLILNNPDLLKDPLKFNQKLTELSSKYTSEWADIAFGTNTNKVTAWDTLTGKEVYGKAEKTFNSFISEYSDDISASLSDSGYLDRSTFDSMLGVNDTLTNTITSLGNYGINVMGMNIVDPKTGMLKFKVDSTGEPIYDTSGNLILEEIVWQTSNPDGKVGFVSYNLDSSSKQEDRWSYRLGTNQESKPSDKNTIVTPKSEEQIQNEKKIVEANGENPDIVSKTEVKNANKITKEAVKEQKGKAESINKTNDDSGEFKIEQGNIHKSTVELNDSVENYVSNNANSADRDTLKAFLWQSAGNREELENILKALEKQHDKGKFVPGITDQNQYQAFIDSVTFEFKNKRGWK